MSREQLIEDLRLARERLFALIKPLAEEQFRHTPHSETWNVATHLAHLLRCERLYAACARIAIDDDNPRVESTGDVNDDDPARAQRLAVPQIVHGMQASRRDLISALESDDALDRTFTHATRGSVTVRDIVVKAAAHEREHADAIEALIARLPASPEPLIPIVPRS